jgi:DNA-binding NarL/FixJ family response regulator
VTIRLVMADDHPVVLMGLESLFAVEQDFEIVARCVNGEEALEAALEHRPDILLLDLRMPKLDGLSVLDALRHAGSPTRSMLLSATLEDAEIRRALQLGARGVVLKEQAPQQLVKAIRTVHAGGWWLEQTGVSPADLTEPKADTPADTSAGLTDRERQVVALVCDGLRNKEIARDLGIAEGTVKIHLNNIYRKLGVDSRVTLVLHARNRS